MEFLGFIGLLGLLFWGGLAFAAFLVSWLTDEDRPVAATLVALGTIAAILFVKDVNPIDWVANNPVNATLAIPAYLFAGTAWGVFKWRLFFGAIYRRAAELRREYDAMVANFEAIDITMTRKSAPDTWKDFLLRKGFKYALPIQVADHKARVIGWMMWWPASFVWTLLNDPVRRAFKTIYYRISTTLQRMSDRHFQSVSQGWNTEAVKAD